MHRKRHVRLQCLIRVKAAMPDRQPRFRPVTLLPQLVHDIVLACVLDHL